jgi:hypothetical protein
VSPSLDVVLQGVSRMRADGDWTVRISQGFVRWSPDESWVLRAGRIGYDIYLLAESRQVGIPIYRCARRPSSTATSPTTTSTAATFRTRIASAATCCVPACSAATHRASWPSRVLERTVRRSDVEGLTTNSQNQSASSPRRAARRG